MLYYGQTRLKYAVWNTAKLPLYKEAEMMQMLKQIKAGMLRSEKNSSTAISRLVQSVIQRFSSRGENPDDLFQVGCIGLIKALDNFDMRARRQIFDIRGAA